MMFEVSLKYCFNNSINPITYAGNVLNGGMSIGCAIYPQDAVDQSSLLSCADMALHDLKARGRGGIRMYNPSMMQLTEAIASQLNIARQLIRHHTINLTINLKLI
jgi:predicted signal transduction protein with EAL and GGDEF domain